MKILRILGIVVVVAGIACIFFSNYISTQVSEGKIKIEKGQKTVDQTNSLFSSSPYTKQIGKGVTSSGQKKINAGKEDVAYYEQLAQTLKISGIVGIVAGAALTIYSFFGSRKKRR
jgi:uncharacterized protein YjeT (DUF2065 family)